uniref:Putative truncated S-adenosylmethionine synthase n=1 Tax=Streptomyces sp. 2238-SVT4 TaxID=681626 RepID=D5MRK3_9ACTN|nr:putative truncated S-adenosylmethionine synthase [Streptomyces sp. 2238-SVT4]
MAGLRNLSLGDATTRSPTYLRSDAACGHFVREPPDFTWQRTDRVEALRTAAGL